MKHIFSSKVRELRQSAGLTQEQLAAECGVSVQAVSKWECAGSYPDIELLIWLAERFEVTLDVLLREVASTAVEEVCLTALPQDDRLRVVQCIGQQVLTQTEYNPEIKIPLKLDNAVKEDDVVHIEIWGNADIEGDVNGDVNAGGVITCGDVKGDAVANGAITCGNVEGDAAANGAITCGNVEGDVNASGGVTCGNVEGDVNADGDVTCGDVEGDVNAGGGVICGNVEGDVNADGDVTCGDVEGDVNAGGDVQCGDIGGDVMSDS